jgi:hypothetical protein
MKRRRRIYRTAADKALWQDRWQPINPFALMINHT